MGGERKEEKRLINTYKKMEKGKRELKLKERSITETVKKIICYQEKGIPVTHTGYLSDKYDELI